jgi:hypothetical protein
VDNHSGQAVTRILVNSTWSQAFEKLGVGATELTLNSRLVKYMLKPEEVIAEPPNDDHMEMLTGRHRVQSARHFLNVPRKLLAARGAAAAAAVEDSEEPHDPELAAPLGPVMEAHVSPLLHLRRWPSALKPLPPPADP